MALTDAEKTSIKRHLGYHAVAQSRFPLVEGFSALSDILADLPAATEAEVRAILTRLANLETAMDDGRERLAAAKVGAITLNGAELVKLTAERSRWRRELSNLL